MKKFFFEVGQSFSEITPESAEQGDFSGTGWEVETTNDWTISDILRALRGQGLEEVSNNGRSLNIYGWKYTSCYKTGTERQLCLHVEGSKRNIQRLLKIINKKKS